MDIKTEKIKNDELVFFGVYGLHLRWTKQSFFSYLDAPRPNHGLMYLLCDSILIEYPDGESERFYRGNIVYIPEGLNYKIRFFGNSEHLEALLINFSVLGKLPFINKIVKIISDGLKSIISVFYSIISLYTQSKNYKNAVMSHFYHLIDLIEIHREDEIKASVPYKSILPAVIYIDSHVGDALRIPELAKLCLLSETVFRKRFKAETGKTPIEYITDLKLEKARSLLRDRDIPVSAIVSDLNFYDSAYFNKLFKKKYGISPSVFKANME